MCREEMLLIESIDRVEIVEWRCGLVIVVRLMMMMEEKKGYTITEVRYTYRMATYNACVRKAYWIRNHSSGSRRLPVYHVRLVRYHQISR